jgi:hypothetical protein
MCYFILAVLPATTDWNQFESVCRKHKIYMKPLENQSLKSRLGDVRVGLVSARNDHCDCDSSIGRDYKHKPHDQSDDSEKKEREKLKKKGWSAAKINRALTDRQNAHHTSNDTDELSSWLAFMNTTVQTAGSIGLLLHIYSGDLEAETIELASKAQIKIGSCELETLTAIQCDTLYSFTK